MDARHQVVEVDRMVNVLVSVLCTFFLIVEIFCIKIIPVLKSTFPLENTDAVMYTLTQNVEGSRDFVMSLLLHSFVSSLILSFVLVLTSFAVLFIFCYLRKRNVLKLKFIPSYKVLIVVLNLICFVFLAKSVYSDLPVIDYYVAWKDTLDVPGHSEFYKQEYIDPDSVHIEFKEKKNLILIFLESMEYNFQDSVNGGNHPRNLIPEISEYIKNEQSFIPGGTQVAGMGWTIADVVAKTCGIPLVLPPSIRNDVKLMKSFLPGVTCLTDILIGNDYNVVVSKGANIKFSNMDVFLNCHSAPQAFGLMEYMKDKQWINSETISEWGVQDSLHYELVKEHIDRISKQEKPWALWFFTVNTHTPHGILDSTCGIAQDISESERMSAIIRCSSHQLDNFIKWAKEQEWFDNTVIAVMGDHAMMAAPEFIGFKDLDFTHYWLDFFINSSQITEKTERTFTSLDMFPTILEAIGADIPGRALGLGRSLYSGDPTLLEKYGIDSLNRALDQRSVEYDSFHFFEKRR
jgi:phosphoglycerol transferase